MEAMLQVKVMMKEMMQVRVMLMKGNKFPQILFISSLYEFAWLLFCVKM